MDLDQITKVVEELEGKATKISETLEAATSPEDQEAAKADLKAVTDRLEVLESEKVTAEAIAEKKAMQEEIKSLKDRFESARKAPAGFNFGIPTSTETESVYGKGAKQSFYGDVKAANKGSRVAAERLEEALETPEGKAMKEATDASGGFLVPPEISDELITLRNQGGILRGLIPSQQIGVEELRIAAIDNGLAVAWTAELAEKITRDLGFSELSVNVFTAAGMAVASNQLLADSRFSIDTLVNSDLAKRFIALEEIAILNGSGTGQPLGIRQTPGVESIPLTSTTIPDLLDAITNAITEVYATYFGAPDGIVMHPRTWGRIVKARETTSPSTYLIGAGSSAFGRRGQDPLPGYGTVALPRGELFGVPVYTSANVPSNLGDGENESVIYVANFSEGLILDRQGITTDQSEHVFFTSNQTVFRSEERMGFTAARYPDAFKVIEGSGLVEA